MAVALKNSIWGGGSDIDCRRQPPIECRGRKPASCWLGRFGHSQGRSGCSSRDRQGRSRTRSRGNASLSREGVILGQRGGQHPLNITIQWAPLGRCVVTELVEALGSKCAHQRVRSSYPPPVWRCSDAFRGRPCRASWFASRRHIGRDCQFGWMEWWLRLDCPPRARSGHRNPVRAPVWYSRDTRTIRRTRNRDRLCRDNRSFHWRPFAFRTSAKRQGSTATLRVAASILKELWVTRVSD